MKENHVAAQKISELQQLVEKYEKDLAQATDVGDLEAKVFLQIWSISIFIPFFFRNF